MLRRLALLLGALALSLVAASSTASASAAADPPGCSRPSWSDLDLGTTYINVDSYTMRDGPYSACNPIMNVTPYDIVKLDCYYVNVYGNTWSHVRVNAVSGWIWDVRLQNGGSFERC